MADPGDVLNPSRRRLLRRGALGGALLLLGGTLPLAFRSTRLGTAPRRPLKLLTLQEHAVFAAAAARLVPGDGAGPTWPSAASLDCAGKVDALVSTLHPAVGSELRTLLRMFESALFGVAIAGSPTPFTRCTPAQQDARLEAWRTSRLAVLRSGHQALRRLAHASYYSSPETYALVGYPGPPDVARGPA